MEQSVEYTILDAKGATGVGKNIFCEDFDHAVFTLATDGGGDAALTVKFQGAQTAEAPNFAGAQSVTNMWTYIETKDYYDGSSISGGTGIPVTSADGYRQVEANINGLTWLNAEVTARTEGEVTVKVRLYKRN